MKIFGGKSLNKKYYKKFKKYFNSTKVDHHLNLRVFIIKLKRKLIRNIT